MIEQYKRIPAVVLEHFSPYFATVTNGLRTYLLIQHRAPRIVIVGLFLLFLHETGFTYTKSYSPNSQQHQLTQSQDYFHGASQQPTKQGEGKSLLPLGLCGSGIPALENGSTLLSNFVVTNSSPPLSSLLIYTQTTASHL